MNDIITIADRLLATCIEQERYIDNMISCVEQYRESMEQYQAFIIRQKGFWEDRPAQMEAMNTTLTNKEN